VRIYGISCGIHDDIGYLTPTQNNKERKRNLERHRQGWGWFKCCIYGG
jgi:hypothetical protein